ncbi:hypothetical protein ACQP25_44985 (plasmid) [Microtetraspora malaysiensis]|uniref:hypothetical protein n=1 Tax=Microtetraspora malaysiensis TaxID=161358 RepID=UPI003D89B604
MDVATIGDVEHQAGAADATPTGPSSDDGALNGKVIEPVTKFGDDDGRTLTLAEYESRIRDVTHQYLLVVGRSLRAIRDNELYAEEGYPSFEAYVNKRWEWSRQHAHRLIKSVRTAEIVAPHAECEIKEGHTRVLDRIYEAKTGPGEAKTAILEVWNEASTLRRPTADALERLAIAKGHLEAPKQKAAPEAAPLAVITGMRQALKAFNLHQLRTVAQETPEAAREIQQECEQIGGALLALAGELSADLNE